MTKAGRSSPNLRKALAAAVKAAKGAGALMRKNLHEAKKANEVTLHDIKLELDVRCQKVIESELRKAFPTVAILGEEEILGDPESEYRWVVDPIDGTVNFSYGIPHAAVSIALQVRRPQASDAYEDGYSTIVGMILDPFCEELWTAIRGDKARLNGTPVHVSRRTDLGECVIALGFSKTAVNISKTMPYMFTLAHRVRKIRIMGSAALSLVYVANGRFDAYIERGLRLWDIAAGGLIVECAGGEFHREAIRGQYNYRMICSNGLIRKALRVPRER